MVFGAYIGATTGQSRSLDPNRLFSSLILINLVANPLVVLLQTFSHIGAAIGCFTRIQEFLQSEELSDSRVRTHGVSDDDRSENQFKPQINSKQEKRGAATLLKGPVLEIVDGSFGWDDKALVKDVNLSVGKGEHVIITGPVGSGKSLLLQAIIGEAQPMSGSIKVNDSTVAYCAQTPWVENNTPRDNVVRGALDDEIWRDRVIEACALRELFETKLPDETIGSNGVRISGGERQRLVSQVLG